MKSGMKARLAAVLTALAMMLAIASPAMANHAPETIQLNQGNLISVLNNLNVQITDVRVVDVADVHDITVNVNALQNFLNRNDVDVDIRNVLNNLNVDVDANILTIQGIAIDGTTLVIYV